MVLLLSDNITSLIHQLFNRVILDVVFLWVLAGRCGADSPLAMPADIDQELQTEFGVYQPIPMELSEFKIE